jgi:hypothetical protein
MAPPRSGHRASSLVGRGGRCSLRGGRHAVDSGDLDHPYANWSGSLQPNEMRVTLALIDDGHVVPYDPRGVPT